MDQLTKNLLKQIAELESIPKGAYNFRIDGKSEERNSTQEIEIVSKKDKSGIDIFIKPNTQNKSLHIPVLITKGGLEDSVYNDFYVGENCDVTIIAGCGIHNCTSKKSSHNGIHCFHVGKNSKVKYVEKHLAIGDTSSENNLNPVTNVFMDKNSYMLMETTQIKGVDNSIRKTNATLQAGAKLVVNEKILTEENQTAKTNFKVTLKGKGGFVDVVSRSVAKGKSRQTFNSNLIGKAQCFGHVECDGILMDKANIISVPKIDAQNVDSTLIHEAAIGKIAGDQLTKLMSLGLSQEQAEKEIIASFMS